MSSEALPMVETESGWVQGVRDGDVAAFLGLRYAAPPIGADRRFLPPLPLAPWSGVQTADRFGPTALQTPPQPYNRAQSEDCLTLNVWTPGPDDVRRPVLFFIHGGGFTSGSGSDPSYNGRTLAHRGDLVVVTVNYRLGALGFLDVSSVLGEPYRASGNSGLLDLIAALRWVRDHIARFGGDPSRVTIMGQSAGAKCVGALLCSPVAEGLFQQAIALSGAVQAIRDPNTSARLTAQFLRRLGTAPQEAARLTTLPAEALLAAQREWLPDFRGVHAFGPVVDGVVLREPPLAALARRGRRLPPLLIGTTRYETAGFIADHPALQEPAGEMLACLFGRNAPVVEAAGRRAREPVCGRPEQERAAWESVLTDYMYRFAAIRTAEAYAAAGAPAWLYRFDAGGDSARHGSELPYAWGRAVPAAHGPLAESMQSAWIRFIRSGSPSGDTLDWPRYERGERLMLALDETCRTESLAAFADDPAFPTQALLL